MHQSGPCRGAHYPIFSAAPPVTTPKGLCRSFVFLYDPVVVCAACKKGCLMNHRATCSNIGRFGGTLLLMLSAGGCGPSADPESSVCEQAQARVYECTGKLMEVPECDDDMATFGNMVLQMGCEDLAALDWPSDGKADSWIDDNTPDTNIFESLAGMPCKNDGDCPNDQLCIDDVCFEGLGTLQATAFWDSHFASEENHGNVLEPLPTGPSSLDARIMLADQATSSIHFVVLYWTADETGLALVDSFCRAVQRGVEVRLIFDSFYQSMSDHVALEQLRDCGVTVLGFNPIGGWLKVADEVRRIERVHEKIFIVDGRVAIMGGRNVNNHYFGQGQWFDYDVILEGPAARSMQAIFLKQWDQFVVWEREANCPQQKKRGYFCPSIDEPVRSTMSRYFPPVESQSGVSTVRSIYSEPRTQSDSAGHILHAALLRMAKTSSQSENA